MYVRSHTEAEHIPRHAVSIDLTLGETMLLPTIAPQALPPTYGPIGDHTEKQRNKSDLDRFRSTLTSLTPRDMAQFDAHLGSCVQPTVGRRSQLLRKPEYLTWATWITQNADTEELLAILEQHNRIVDAINRDPQVEDLAANRREWVADRIETGVDDDWLNPHMSKVAMALREDVDVWFGDDLRDVILRQRGSDAYYAQKDHHVVLRQHLDIIDPDERRQAAVRGIYSHRLPHELLHAGATAEWMAEWMIEVAVEDITQMIIHGGNSVKALEPLPGEGYPNMREIRQTLLRNGSRLVADSIYIRAVSSEGPDSEAARELTRQLSLSWGVPDPLLPVTRRLIAYQSTLREHYKHNPERSGAWISAQAAFEVNRELKDEPEKIFGVDYKKPQLRAGAAALSGASR